MTQQAYYSKNGWTGHGMHSYAIACHPKPRLVTGLVVSLPSFPGYLFGVRKRKGESELHLEEITTGLAFPGITTTALCYLDSNCVRILVNAGHQRFLPRFTREVRKYPKLNAVRWPHLGTGTTP